MPSISGRTNGIAAVDDTGMELHAAHDMGPSSSQLAPLLDDAASSIPAWGVGSVQQDAPLTSRACTCLRPCWRGRGWCWRTGLVCTVLLPLLIVLGVVLRFTAVPAFVRSRVAATTLRIESITMTAPRWPTSNTESQLAGGGWGFTMIAESVLSGLSPVDGTIQAMTTTLSFGGQPFAVTVLPQLHARAGVDNHFSLITDVAITDIDAFDSFGRAMLEQQQVSFTLAGDATVSASVAGISVTVTGVPFSKTVTIAGANNLTSAAVTSFSLTGSNASTAIVNLTVALANPSVVAIEPLGDLAVDVQYEGAYFGTLLCRNVSLQPGVNSLAFLGALTPADMGAADSLISAYLGGRPVIMTASASPDWPTSLPIYAPLLAGVVIATQLNGSATPLINSIVVERMSLAPQGLSDVAVTLNASVAINNILGPRSPIAVQSVDMNVTLYGGGQPLGQLIVSQVLESNVAAVGSGVSSSSSGSAPVKADAASASCAADTACLVVPQADVAASLYHARLDALRSSVADAQALPRRQLRGLPAEAADGSPALVNLRMPAADAQRFRLEWRPGEASAAGARGFQAAVLTGLAAAQSRGSEYSSTLLGDAAVGDAPLPIFYVPLSVQATLSIEQSAARFDSFILGFIANETVAMGLRNDDASALTTRLHCALGNLTVSIPLDQVTSVAGMGGFPFVSVDSFSVTGVRQPGQPVLFAPRLTSLAADIATAAAGDSVGGSRSTASLGSGAARSADAAGSASGLATDYGAVDIAIQVRLLNPSPATFSMGHNASFGMYVDGQRIGGALAVNTTLVPGMNVLHMNGSIAPQPSGLPAVSTLFTAYLTGRNGSVTVRGEGISLPEGQPTPQWLLDAIRSISLEASVPAAANLTVLQDVSLVSMSLDWAPPPPSVPSFAAVDAGDAAGGEVQSRGLRGGTGPEAGSPGEGSAAVASAATASALGNGSGGDRDADADPIPYLSAVVAGTVHLPFVIPVSFPAVDVTLVFTDPGSGIAMAYVELVGQRADYTPFATPQLPLSQRGLHFGSDSATASATAAGSEAASDIKDAAAATASRADVDATDSIVYPAVGALTLYLDRSPLHILAADVFASFMTTTLLASSAPLLLTGSASPTVSLVFGNITIANVSVTQLTPAPGMGGLAHPPPRVLSVDITNTTIDTATLSVCLNVTNPSIVTASLGPASLMLQYEGVDVATAFIENLQVSPGGNLLNATGLLRLPSNESDPVTYGAITTFISRYLSRVDSELRLLGTPQSSPYPLLQPAFSRLNTTAVFPGLSTNLLKSGTLYWDVDLFNIPTHPNGTLILYNPLSLDLELLNASLTVFLCANETVDGTGCNDGPDYSDPVGFFYDGDLAARPASVPARSTIRSRVYPIELVGGALDDLLVMEELYEDGDALTKVNGTITSRIGNFFSTLFFEQFLVPLYLRPANETPPWNEGPVPVAPEELSS